MALQVLGFSRDDGGVLVFELLTDGGQRPRVRLAPGQIPPTLITAIGTFEQALIAAAQEHLEVLAGRNQTLRQAVTDATAEITASKAAVDANATLSAAQKTGIKALFDNVQADLNTAGP